MTVLGPSRFDTGYCKGTPADHVDEIRAIVDSITFE